MPPTTTYTSDEYATSRPMTGPPAAGTGVNELLELLGGQVGRLEEQLAIAGKMLGPVLDNRAAASINDTPPIDTRSVIGGQLAALLSRVTVVTERLGEMIGAVDLR